MPMIYQDRRLTLPYQRYLALFIIVSRPVRGLQLRNKIADTKGEQEIKLLQRQIDYNNSITTILRI